MYEVDNAVIMAAGVSSRFVPLSWEIPKPLLRVKGEVLIERQIRQLLDAGIHKIYVIVGYMAEKFSYLEDAFGVVLLHNPDYAHRNNNGSIYAARHVLRNSYVCSGDNYFSSNPFTMEVMDSYYAAIYAEGATKEWCMTEGADGYIAAVAIGGKNAWYMLGHTFWNETFSRNFLRILEREYSAPDTAGKLWEHIFIDHLASLKMRIKKYLPHEIFEFDTLEELRAFDESYVDDTRSGVLRWIARELGVRECALQSISADDGDGTTAFVFRCNGSLYRYHRADASFSVIKEK